jgi:hypothetical protein
MIRRDYMPVNDGEFDTLQNNVYTTSARNAAQWLIPSVVIAGLDAPRARWNAAITLYNSPKTRTSAVTQEKNDAKKAYTAVLRTFIQGQLRHNDRVSDGDLRSMGLSVYDYTPTKVLPPASRIELDVDFGEIMQHTIRVRDSESRRRAKPPHVIGFELWRHIGDHTQPSIDELQLTGLVVSSPYILKYTDAERRKTVWYAARWVNTRGEKGPWSLFVSVVVA